MSFTPTKKHGLYYPASVQFAKIIYLLMGYERARQEGPGAKYGFFRICRAVLYKAVLNDLNLNFSMRLYILHNV